MHISLDGAGRVVLPKALRDSLHLRPGEPLVAEQRDEEIVIRRGDAGVHLEQIDGLWVVCGGPKLDENSIVDEIRKMREERDREVGGW